MVLLRNLKKSFGKRGRETPVLKGINFHAEKGKTTAVIGPSGGGKSTMLRCVNLLEIPDSGEVSVAGETLRFEGRKKRHSQKEILALRSHTSMVFQNFELFPHKTVLENIMEGPILVKKETTNEARERALALLAKVDLFAKKDSYPSTLSGGQQQRAAIARALAMRPGVLLFDEPTSALDPELEREVLKVIRTLVEENNTIIIVTHNLLFAREIADKIAFLDGGEIAASGSPGDIFSAVMPKRVRDFIAALSPSPEYEI